MGSPFSQLNLCLRCRRRLRTCVCAHLRPFDTRSRFLILMHPMEYKKEKVGTGRFTHLILKNSQVFVDVNFDENEDFQRALRAEEYETFLLYPGEKALNLTTETRLETTRKKQFIVIDGTWPCAKKMVKLSKSLHHLPRVSFTTDRISEFKVKHQPLPQCLSTVESIHQVLLELNRLQEENTSGQEENLMSVFKETVRQQIELSQSEGGYRKKPFTLPEERRVSKKYESRLLFFKS